MSKLVEVIKLVKIVSFLEEYKIKNYTINEDFTVDVDGDVYLSNKKLTKIPIQFGKVKGWFDVSENQLTFLKGCPEYVEESFYCYNNQLKSFKGAPEYVGGDFWCDNNQLENLIGSPEYVGGDFYCSNNPLLKLLKGIGQVNGIIHSDFFEDYLEDYEGEL